MECRNPEDRIDPEQTESANTKNGNQCRCSGFAHSSQTSGRHFHQAAQEVRNTDIRNSFSTVCDGFLRINDIKRK